ncbi:hypothetical protein A3A70_03195 [candidate division WWE3 bacterium RIFCSPLOWO2_01_FULL_42_11]|uniref:Methyltransferase type 11 domain-containing protein n=1 Tax=candidate division WWE3 bacterium RIFCSPLOWO2_01_FULL_42_11 TaxID=1802627 RepID=A0A1F4VN82_UNCKA|nr:MAG: hypothetical protein A3A70_03195 [candidate division WWE3 bacterium RIFCSPLOWO2_01_FULL_42_11]
MADNSLPPDAKQRFYDQIDNWRGYNKQKIKVYLNLLNQLIESKGIDNLRVLDLGCYDGRFGKLVLDETGLLIDGADISPDNLSKATSLRRKFHEDLDSPSWWKIDGTYDLIFAGDIIEHLINTDEFLININRLLKPNGLVVVSTPNVASLGRRLLLLFGKSPFLEISKIQEVNLHYAPIVGHIRYFTPSSLQSLLSYWGFKPISYHHNGIGLPGLLNSYKLGVMFPGLATHMTIIAKKSRNIETDLPLKFETNLETADDLPTYATSAQHKIIRGEG